MKIKQNLIIFVFLISLLGIFYVSTVNFSDFSIVHDSNDNLRMRINPHETNITFDDWDAIPNVTEWNDGTWDPINTTTPNEIIYGDKFNITLFWYDVNITGNKNESGCSFGSYNLTAVIQPIWGATEVNLLGAYTMFNMYVITGSDPDYKGLYVIEFDTEYFMLNYPFNDIVNGGPLGDGTYNLTVRFWLTGGAFDPEYELAIANVTIKILPVPTGIATEQYTMEGIILPKTANGCVTTFGTTSPDPLYYVTEFNFTDNHRKIPISTTGVFSSMVKAYFENYSSGVPNGVLVPWIPIYFDKGTGAYKLNIFTDTQWVLNNEWIPFNSSGYKNINITIEIAKPNYNNATCQMLIAFRRHDTRIAYYNDSFGSGAVEIPFTNETIGYGCNKTIYFRYLDEDYQMTESERYIEWSSVVSNWTFDWGHIEEIPTDRGWYRMLIDVNTNYNVGVHHFTINFTDTFGYRENASITWNVTIISPPGPTLESLPASNISTTIFLNWTALSWPDYYLLFRDTEPIMDLNNATLIYNTTLTSYLDQFLYSSDMYYYAVIGSNNTLNLNTTISNFDPISLIYPSPPNISATLPFNTATGTVFLTWTSVSWAEFYMLFRSTSEITTLSCSSDYLLSTLSVMNIGNTVHTNFTDSLTVHGTYYYVLIAVNATAGVNSSIVQLGSITFLASSPPLDPLTGAMILIILLCIVGGVVSSVFVLHKKGYLQKKKPREEILGKKNQPLQKGKINQEQKLVKANGNSINDNSKQFDDKMKNS